MPQIFHRLLPAAAPLVGLVIAAGAAQPAKPAAGAGPVSRASSATNAAPAVPEPPKSVFYVPTSIQDPAKDPFFPRSTRLRKTVVIPSTITNVPAAVVKLELKGISGAVEHPLAIINSRTFGIGETGEVLSGNSHVRIRVVDIKGDAVTVEANGERQVLRLRSGL